MSTRSKAGGFETRPYETRPMELSFRGAAIRGAAIRRVTPHNSLDGNNSIYEKPPAWYG